MLDGERKMEKETKQQKHSKEEEEEKRGWGRRRDIEQEYN